LLKAADAFVSTNREDNALTTAILEAGLSGLPLALSGLPKVREIFKDGDHALLFAPGDDSALAEALVRCLRNLALKAKLTANSAKLLAGLGLGADEILRRTQEVYNEVRPPRC
jgi:glycosyltransferase involved in cell wall biosynthesis